MGESGWNILGWVGAAVFVTSFLVKSRSLLHLLGLLGSVIKLVYTWHYKLWPLAVNWAILIVIEAIQWWRNRKNPAKPTVDECIDCQR